MGVLAGGRVQHQQACVRRLGVELADARAGSSAAPPSGRPCSAAARRCRSAAGRRPRPCAASSASKARPAASAPVSRAITGTPARSPQIFSCSTAAARNVSPAASITILPGALEALRQLADGGGLAGAVDADHQHHMRLARAQGRAAAPPASGWRRSRPAKISRTSCSVISLSKRSLASASVSAPRWRRRDRRRSAPPPARRAARRSSFCLVKMPVMLPVSWWRSATARPSAAGTSRASRFPNCPGSCGDQMLVGGRRSRARRQSRLRRAPPARRTGANWSVWPNASPLRCARPAARRRADRGSPG